MELQRAIARKRIVGAIPQDVLLLLEHTPVVTLGRSTKPAHLKTSPAALAQRGIELCESERGGDVTFHGRGQLVGYPIIDLRRHRRDLHWYLRRVEEVLIVALGQLGLPCERRHGFTGVWTGGLRGDAATPRKIASIGVHARDWVTWHGFAVNVTTDLSFFDLIVPCGIAGVEMTSVVRELGAHTPGIDAVADTIARTFAGLFDLEWMPAPENLDEYGTARSSAGEQGATGTAVLGPDARSASRETAPTST